jgi:hypothetical protein
MKANVQFIWSEEGEEARKAVNLRSYHLRVVIRGLLGTSDAGPEC